MAHADYEAVIGLEVHVQLLTETKLFCRCANRFGAPPNTLVCPVCLGYPGTLPVPNRHAVDLAITLALAVGCTVHERSLFARKNYFYPDLPKGYQISQYDRPLAEDGLLPLTSHDKGVRIERLHLEEDAGKLLHEAPGGARCGASLVASTVAACRWSDRRAADWERAERRTPADAHPVLLYTQTTTHMRGTCAATTSLGAPRGETAWHKTGENGTVPQRFGRRDEIGRHIALLAVPLMQETALRRHGRVTG